MDNLASIESYLTGQMTATERNTFEASLRTDPALADDLAFYVMAHQTAKTQANERRRAEWKARQVPVSNRSLGQWSIGLMAAAAAVVLILSLGWYFMLRPTAPELADAYVQQNLTQLPVTMDTHTDSLRTGVRLYNSGKLTQAGAVFETLLRHKPADADLLKLAGLVSLRLGNYDQAIARFSQLSQRTDLFDNPGMFYQALALVKRNQPKDKNLARELLNVVITKNLSGKADAEKLLERL